MLSMHHTSDVDPCPCGGRKFSDGARFLPGRGQRGSPSQACCLKLIHRHCSLVFRFWSGCQCTLTLANRCWSSPARSRFSATFPAPSRLVCQTVQRSDPEALGGFVAQTCHHLVPTTGLFLARWPRQVLFCRRERGWSAPPGLRIETRHPTLCPVLAPWRPRVSITLRELRDCFDPQPLCAAQHPVRPHPGSGERLLLHDFCQSVTLAFGQKTHVSHDHHPRGPCCSSARISYDAPCMGAIYYQKIFASALTGCSFYSM